MEISNSSRASANVLEFYFMIVTLKDLIRSGWIKWNVPEERRESVAEHVFSTMILAISMYSEFLYSVDIMNVLQMLLVHELEEIKIGDITPFDGVSEQEKQERGHKAIEEVLSPLKDKEKYKALILEFDQRTTKDAKFAYQCDKLDADLMAFRYFIKYGCDLEHATEWLKKNPSTIEPYKKGARSIADFFYYCDKDKFDKNFRKVLDTYYDMCNIRFIK